MVWSGARECAKDMRGKVEEESWSGRGKEKTRREEKAMEWEEGNCEGEGKESGVEKGEGRVMRKRGKESK